MTPANSAFRSDMQDESEWEGRLKAYRKALKESDIKIDKLQKELNEKIDKKVDEKVDNLQKEVNEKVDNLQKEMNDKTDGLDKKLDAILKHLIPPAKEEQKEEA